MKINTKQLVITAVIAGIYATLTIFLAPISYGAVQFRISEVMTLLAFLNPACAPGLILGCIIANFFSPFGIIDVLIGSVATFFAVVPMRYTKNIYLASLMPTLSNGIIVGLEVAILVGLPKFETMFYVAFGEFVVVSVVGVFAVKLLMKNQQIIKLLDLGSNVKG